MTFQTNVSKPRRFPYQARMAKVVKDFENDSRQKKVQPYKLPTTWRQGHCHTLVRVSHGWLVGHLSASAQEVDNYKTNKQTKLLKHIIVSHILTHLDLSDAQHGFWHLRSYVRPNCSNSSKSLQDLSKGDDKLI